MISHSRIVNTANLTSTRYVAEPGELIRQITALTSILSVDKCLAGVTDCPIYQRLAIMRKPDDEH